MLALYLQMYDYQGKYQHNMKTLYVHVDNSSYN